MTRTDYEDLIARMKQEIKHKQAVVEALEEAMEAIVPLPQEPPHAFDVEQA